jgi:hypothetical protein
MKRRQVDASAPQSTPALKSLNSRRMVQPVVAKKCIFSIAARTAHWPQSTDFESLIPNSRSFSGLGKARCAKIGNSCVGIMLALLGRPRGMVASPRSRIKEPRPAYTHPSQVGTGIGCCESNRSPCQHISSSKKPSAHFRFPPEQRREGSLAKPQAAGTPPAPD